MIPNIVTLVHGRLSQAYKYDPHHATGPFGSEPDVVLHITTVLQLGKRTAVVMQLQYLHHHYITQTGQNNPCTLHKVPTPYEPPKLVEHSVCFDKTCVTLVAFKTWAQFSFRGRRRKVTRQLPWRRTQP